MQLEDNMKNHIVYKTTNIINGMIYIGVNSNNAKGYLGSGVNIRNAIRKYGKENFSRTILYRYDTRDEALLKEAELVNAEFLLRDDTYNIAEGGGIFTSINRVTVKDPTSISGYKSISCEEFINSDYEYLHKGMVTIIDNESKSGYRNITKEEFNTGNYKHVLSNTVVIKCNYSLSGYRRISIDEFNTGNYIHANSELVTVVNPDNPGKHMHVTQEEYAKGEYIHSTTNKVVAKCTNTGEIISMDKEDPRWTSGEFVGNTKGTKWINNGETRKRVPLADIDMYLEQGYILGSKIN